MDLRRLAAAFVACLLLSSLPATAEEVDLQLLLAIDVSGSVDSDEAKLQRQGYMDAFADERILRAIARGPKGRIAVAYYEWSDSIYQRLVVDWTVISDHASAQAFIKKLHDASISIATRTSISGALDYGLALFARSPHSSARKVIDVSGDGPNNDGPFVTETRDRVVRQKITINGLPILNDRPNRMGFPSMPDLDLYYQDCVIGGPGAFIVAARDFDNFAEAVKQKLFLEVAGIGDRRSARIAAKEGFTLPIVWARPARSGIQPANFKGDCRYGERQSHEFWRFRQTFPD
ncbi:MAG: DUF1194 domain-containing protein [Reyranellaceae bacterium]